MKGFAARETGQKGEFTKLDLDFYTGNPAEFPYKKMGFTEEGTLRKNCRKDRMLYDMQLMSMLKKGV